MSTSTSLDLANFTTVWDHNFSSQPNMNGFNTVWGDVTVQNGAAVLTSTAASGWAQAGFMITPSGASAGNGYGLYSITMSMNDNGAVEGPGGYACLWPSTNNWPGPELDLVEKGGANSGSNGYSTIHWAGADGSNQYTPNMFPSNIDVTQANTYAMDWEPGRITLYIDGQEIYTTTQNVPKDFADGGQNEAFGAGEEPAWAASQQGGNTQNQVQVYDISYSASTPGSGGVSLAATAGSTSGAPVSSSTISPPAVTVPDDGSSSYSATINSTSIVSSVADKAVFVTGGSDTMWLGSGGSQTASVVGDGNTLSAASGNDAIYASGNGNALTASGAADTLTAAGSNADIVLAGTGDTAQVTGTGSTVWTSTDGQNVGLSGDGNTVVLGSSGNAIYDSGSNNTITLTAQAHGNVTWDTVLTNGDKIDLSQVLAAAGWDGLPQDVSNYLSVTSGSWGLELSVSSGSGSASTPVLDIVGSKADIGLNALLQHAVI